MSTRDVNIAVLKEFRKKRSRKPEKTKSFVNASKDLGPPDMSNRDAIVKIFKSTEAYEAFRNKYLNNSFSYDTEYEDKSIERMRNRCRNKKKRQDSMYQQAIKNKKTLSHNEKLYETIFRDQDFYNNYSKENLDYSVAEQALNGSTNNITYDDTLETYDEMNINKMRDIPSNPPPTESRGSQDNEKDSKKEDSDSNEKFEIVDTINSNMVEKNSSYKSFSFSDSLKLSESKRNNVESRKCMFPPTKDNRRTSKSNLVPLCMDDVINSGSVKLPVIEPKPRKNWHALSISEVYEQRPLGNPFSDTPKTKFIIPGIEKKYQRFIPSKNGNTFWRVCDGNIYDNLY